MNSTDIPVLTDAEHGASVIEALRSVPGTRVAGKYRREAARGFPKFAAAACCRRARRRIPNTDAMPPAGGRLP